MYKFSQLEELLVPVLKSGRTPFIWGPPGIGKTMLAINVAKKIKYDHVYHLDATLFQSSDYAATVPNEENKKLELYVLDMVPSPKTIILIDDLPYAEPYQMSPLLKLVLQRMIGNVKLPDSVLFIVTGNREEDDQYVNQIPLPLLNRFVHFEMSPDFEEWIKWAIQSKLDQRVIGFIYAYPSEFCHMPKKGVKAWPTPRSWHILSDILKESKTNDVDTIAYLAKATVGEKVGSLFSEFVRLQMSINPMKIIEEGKGIEDYDNEKMFVSMLSVSQYLVSKPVSYIEKHIENIRKYFNSLAGEYRLAFARYVVLNSEEHGYTLIANLEEIGAELKALLDIMSKK